MKLFSFQSFRALSAQTLLHRSIQYFFMLFYVWVALLFFQYLLWAFGESAYFVSRPPSVDAFLPVGALLAAKRFLYTGEYDFVRPAGLTILFLVVGLAFLLRRSSCGYLCPIGGLTGVVERFGARLGIQRRPGKILSLILTLPKYLLFASIFYRLVLPLDVPSISAFLEMPYWRVADTKMFLYFWNPGSSLLVSLMVLFLGSLFFSGFWCRGFCPYGAFLGLFSMLSPVAVRRDAENCSGCGRCASACPARIPVLEKKRISGPECLGCGECIGACKKDCLSFRLGYTGKARRFSSGLVAAATVMILALVTVWAMGTGHWYAPENTSRIRMDHRTIKPMNF